MHVIKRVFFRDGHLSMNQSNKEEWRQRAGKASAHGKKEQGTGTVHSTGLQCCVQPWYCWQQTFLPQPSNETTLGLQPQKPEDSSVWPGLGYWDRGAMTQLCAI